VAPAGACGPAGCRRPGAGAGGGHPGSLAPIRTQFGRFRRQSSGYQLGHLLPERGGDLARALVGSEGTPAAVECPLLLSRPASKGTDQQEQSVGGRNPDEPGHRAWQVGDVTIGGRGPSGEVANAMIARPPTR
jgi:hypothetical protein